MQMSIVQNLAINIQYNIFIYLQRYSITKSGILP